MATASAIDLCSLAWGDHEGNVCLAVRNPQIDRHDKGYWVDHLFKWPAEREKIVELLDRAKESKRDVYWAPAVFDQPTRAREAVSNTSLLWADLDAADPRELPKHLKPTAAWQSSPGRYQAVWQLDRTIRADTQQKLNQRLTYAIGADKGGWDLTQVLRIPGTHNHKYPDAPLVKMLWLNGHKLNPSRLLDDLPEVQSAEVDRTAIEKIPTQASILAQYKLPAHAKSLIKARHAQQGTRSDRLWELECLLAEAGMDEAEIVGVVMPTVWNKFRNRHDELTRLSIEARKAIEHVGVAVDEVMEEVDEVEGPVTWADFDRDHTAVRWMVADVWGEGEVGFISGHPKSYKSWLALDLAVSVATGTRFLGSFQSRKHNVLLIQEEDPKPIMQERLSLVAASKGLVDVKVFRNGTFEMAYDLPTNLHIVSNQGFSINDEWLETLEQWIIDRDIQLTILDPLMMMGGEVVDEFKAFEFMAKILKPLKRLRARTQSAIVVVHHHIKGSNESGPKSMYGSVALWAWEEAAIHLQVMGVGRIVAERFSKHALLSPLTIEIGDLTDDWKPTVVKFSTSNLYDVLVTMEGGATIEELMSYTSLGREAITRQLNEFARNKRAEKAGTRRSGPGRPSAVWKAVVE